MKKPPFLSKGLFVFIFTLGIFGGFLVSADCALQDSFNTSGNWDSDFGASISQGQTFTASSNYSPSLKIYLKKTGDCPATTVTCYLKETSGGAPTETDVCASTSIDVSAISSVSYSWVDLGFTNCDPLVSSNTYFLWCDTKTAFAGYSGYLLWYGSETSNYYANGARYYSSDNTNWLVNDPNVRDLYFEAYDCSEAATSASATSTMITDPRVYPFIFFGFVFTYLLAFVVAVKI